MAYLAETELRKLNIYFLGKNVLISDRAALHNVDLLSIGDNSRVDDFVSISGKVSIGRNVHIAIGCNIAGGSKGISIGNFSGLAYGVQVFTRIDDYSGLTLSNPTIPDQFKKTYEREINIKAHCKIATYSIVLPGSVLETGCAFSAQSLISGVTVPHHLYGGNPMEIKSKLSNKLLEVEQEYINWELGIK
jgi:acetyltransferase-like isoleucine patch superfamily enzyme